MVRQLLPNLLTPFLMFLVSSPHVIRIRYSQFLDEILEFTSNYKYVIYSIDEEDEDTGVYSISGDVLTLSDVEDVFRFSVSGDTLILEANFYYNPETEDEYETKPEDENCVPVVERWTLKRM